MIYLYPIQKWYSAIEEPSIGYHYVSPSFPMCPDGIYNSVYDEDEIYTAKEQEINATKRRTGVAIKAFHSVIHESKGEWLTEYPCCYDNIISTVACSRDKLREFDTKSYALCVEDDKWVYVSKRGVPTKLSIEEFKTQCQTQEFTDYYYKSSYPTVTVAGHVMLKYAKIPAEAVDKYIHEITKILIRAIAMGLGLDSLAVTISINKIGKKFVQEYKILHYDYLPVYMKLWRLLSKYMLRAIQNTKDDFSADNNAFAVTYDLQFEWDVPPSESIHTFAIATIPPMLDITGISAPLFELDVNIRHTKVNEKYYTNSALGRQYTSDVEGRALLIREPLLYLEFGTMELSELYLVDLLCEELDLSRVQVVSGVINISDCHYLKIVKVKSKATQINAYQCPKDLKVIYEEE